MQRKLISAAVLVLTTSFIAPMALAQATAATAPAGASSGIATQYIEPSVRAQDDFFEHLNGKWLKSVEIPADKSTWGAFHQLRDDTLPQLRAI
ncbi:MAG: M13 family peptidase, partial [Oxalobacteraceae bacterium]